MSYFTVLCITTTVENGEVYNDILFKTVGSYRNSIEFFSQLCERLGTIQVDPMTTAQKKQIMNGDYDVVALLVDPSVFYACEELDDGAELLCQKAIARIDVTKYAKVMIEELWPIKKMESEVAVTAKKE
jgi:hypothetical protein